MTKYWARPGQLLRDHLVGVAEKARALAVQARPDDPEFHRIAYEAGLLHDLGKALAIMIVGDKMATRIHRRVAGHHKLDTHRQKVEAFCDWECARLTKPAKPLNGAQTWAKYYQSIDMAYIVDAFYAA